MAPKPKNLILNLLLAAEGAPLTSADAVTASALFGIRENSVRVALARLSGEGLIESAGRGAYRLGPQAVGLAETLSHWRDAESGLRTWQGAWLMVSTATLHRSDRAALRVRERALALMGFQPLDGALHVRPDNLAGGAASAREQLHKLGLNTAAHVFAATDLDEALDARARSLWKGTLLDQAYADTQSKLIAWLRQSGELEIDVAARECYVLGNQAIRQLVFDPLLPEPLVDVAARQAFRRAVIAFDDAGHRIWRRYLPSLRAAESFHANRMAAPAAMH